MLMRGGEAVPLGLKAFDILLFLIRHRGRVVKKDELLRQIWPDTIVEENNLVRHISALRKALDENHHESHYIMTIPGRGYRFVATVHELEKENEDFLARGGDPAKTTVANGWHSAPDLHHTTANTAAPEVPPNQRLWSSRYTWLLVLSVSVAVIAIIISVISLIRQNSRIDQPVQRRLWQLTFATGLECEPAWSPDGNLIAYSSDSGGNFDIWVRPVGEGSPARVTSSPAHDWQPDWAPAGNRLVFRSERDGGGLFVVPVLGGNERKVSAFGYRPRWSPDGTRILFYSSIPQINTVEIPKVFLVGLDSNQPREVVSQFLTEFSWLRVAWHPDGERISVWGDHFREGWSFWTVPLAGGKPVRSQLTAQVDKLLRAADVTLTDFQWASSGRALYFEGVSRGVENIWKVTVDPQSLRWSSGPERLTMGTGQDTDLRISPDGRRLAFTVRTERTRLWSLPFDSVSGRVKGAGQPVTAADVDADYHDLSPAGDRLVYRAHRADKEELREISLKDGRETVLISDNFSRMRARWSRDGSRLVYLLLRPVDPERTRMGRSFVLLSAGSDDEQILTSSDLTDEVPYDWSADGKWILGNSDRQNLGRRGIALFPIEAAPHAETQMRVLASDPNQNLYQTRFSPDDRWISFIAARAHEAGVSTIYAIPAAGGEWKRLTEGRYFDDKPRWSPDGRKIYFISNRTGFFNVWGLDFDPASGEARGEPFRVTTFESPGHMILTDVKSMELALSDKLIILPITEVSGRIWILEGTER
ncbi:MAG TPA: winged helix-turn-helix domain-containing protein [Blastocatellia bacterium]|nr:winged helix-turn-helix domain-containing protein [Blastocatellia bacterium]